MRRCVNLSYAGEFETHAFFQGGKRNIEANLFAITIRDHFREKTKYGVFGPRDVASSLTCADDWTCEYMSAPYFQRLKEAFEEDGSGYVTISGVNSFVDARPSELGWRYVRMPTAAIGVLTHLSSVF